MKNLKRVVATLAVGAVLLPAVTLATGRNPQATEVGQGTRVYMGSGRVSGQGFGNVTYNGTGTLMVQGNGELSVTPDSHVVISGVGTRTESDAGMIVYEGFNGTAFVTGQQVYGSFGGEVKHFSIRGTGVLVATGTGTINAERWIPSPQMTESNR